MSTTPGMPEAQGLYDPAHEHDACGVGFVVDIKGRKSHAIVSQALTVLKNLLHRGACGCEANTGRRRRHPHPDAPRVPGPRVRPARHRASRPRPLRRRPGLPAARSRPGGDLPRASSSRSSARRARPCSAGATCPPTTRPIGPSARAAEPVMRQVFIGRGAGRARPERLRAQALRDPQARRARRRAAATSRSGSTSTSRASPPTRSSTRACCRPTRSRPCSPT